MAGGLLSLAVVLWFHRQIQPLILMETETQLQNQLICAVNEIVESDIVQEEISYETLITLELDSDGRVTALKTNMGECNRLRAHIVSQLTTTLQALEQATLSVSVGDLLRTTILHDFGPKIPVRVLSSHAISAEFVSQFSSMGINQTRHQIVLEITADLDLLLPGGVQTVSTQTGVVIADTVLLGEVPDSYAEFIGTDTAEDAVDDYFNFF